MMGRDFSGQNLRGRNFQGQNLRSASFVNADIRGANFTDAELQGADFTGAIAGLQKRWVMIQILMAGSLSLFLGCLLAFSLFAVYVIFQSENVEKYTILPGVLLVTIFSIFAFSAITQGSMAEAFRVGAGYITGISVGTLIYSIKNNLSRFIVSCLLIVLNICGVLLFLFLVKSPIQISNLLIIIDVGFIILVCYVCLTSVMKGKKLAVNLQAAVDFSTIGGTVFCGANLSGANLSKSQLGSTNFVDSLHRKTNISRVCFTKVKDLDIVRTGSTILADPIVRQLLTTGKLIHHKDLSNRNLQGANLNFSQLEGANFRNANLSQASFYHADLRSVTFTKAQAVGTDFSGAILTGACFESWNIDQAVLIGIQCKYYFLREKSDEESGSFERRPHDPERFYAPGDAEKLLTEARDIVEVLLKQCINAKDLAQSLQRLTESYPEATLQKLERKDNSDFLVTLTVPPDTDKANVEKLLHIAYHEIRALRGEVKELHTLRAVDLKDALLAIANNPASLIQNIQQIIGDHAVTTQETQSVSAGSNSFINTGTLNAINSTLGIISGNATTSIGQLPTPESNEPDLKTALTALQTALESSPLSDEDKAEALEQVKAIADAGQNPKDSALQKCVKTAMKVLKGTIADLPSTEEVVKVLIKIAPIVASFFGMSAL
jgi:uncharacterized protein YjbI with pentapeptide repeats